jgi:hypothetical protein
MAKFTLDIEYEYDFSLIGLSCHARDYKLCWAINNHLGFNLTRQENLKLVTKTLTAEFSHYVYEDDDQRIGYSIISNRGSGGMLIPEHKQTDYFIKVSGASNSYFIKEFIAKLKELDLVLAAFTIDIPNLKSKHNLLLE